MVFQLRGGGRVGLNYKRMCLLKSEGQGSFCGYKVQVSEMSEMNLLKMGAKFGISLNIRENLQQGSSIIV